MSFAVYDSKEPVEFWLSRSTSISDFITWTEDLYNVIISNSDGMNRGSESRWDRKEYLPKPIIHFKQSRPSQLTNESN